MQTYNGKISLLGNGTWVGASGGTRLTVLEIGSKELKKIFLPDYIGNYLKPGVDARILVYKGINQQIIVAAEVDGRKYKIGRSKMFTLAFLPAVFLTFTVGMWAGLKTPDSFFTGFLFVFFLGCLYGLKKMMDYRRF